MNIFNPPDAISSAKSDDFKEDDFFDEKIKYFCCFSKRPKLEKEIPYFLKTKQLP